MLFIGPRAELKDYIEQVYAMYASGDVYVVRWKEWNSSLLSGVLVALHNPKDEEDDGGDLILEEEEKSKEDRIRQNETRGAVTARGRGDTKEHKEEKERWITTEGGKGWEW